MGQWSKINTKQTLFERITGREEGFEDSTARERRALRNTVDTSEEDVPTTRRSPLSSKERRDANKILRQSKPSRRRKKD